VIFPEGTRIRKDGLGRPKRGVGRMALDSGAPIVPVAVHGTERARSGWLIKPVKLRVRCGRPLTFPRVHEASPQLAAAVTDRIWPCVELQYRWLDQLPGVEPKPALVPRPALATIAPFARGRDHERDRRAA
jgi:1-acyl-sn-glycerol-3-phosphate acyltransferase